MSINTIAMSGYVHNIKQPNDKITTFGLQFSRYDFSKKEKIREFVNCSVFGNNKKFIDTYLSEKMWVVVHGSLQCKAYEKDGKNQTFVSISVSEIDFPNTVKKEKTENTSQPDFEDDDVPF